MSFEEREKMKEALKVLEEDETDPNYFPDHVGENFMSKE
jgi:hypothetical protein